MNTLEVSIPKLLTQAEVSKIIRKSESWLERSRWSGEGGPPFKKIGRHVRYSLDDLMQWIESKPKLTSTSEIKKGVRK